MGYNSKNISFGFDKDKQTLYVALLRNMAEHQENPSKLKKIRISEKATGYADQSGKILYVEIKDVVEVGHRIMTAAVLSMMTARQKELNKKRKVFQ